MSEDFVPTFWNTTSRRSGRQKISRVSGGQVAFKKKGYPWQTVNPHVQRDFTCESFPGSVSFPKNAQGTLTAHFNGEYSAKRQVEGLNWSNSEDDFVLRLRTDCPSNSTGIIHPDKPWQVVYHDAFGKGVNLIYGIWRGRTSRVEHVIEITEMPPGDEEYLKYDFFIESEDATAFVGKEYSDRPWAGNYGDTAKVEGFSVFLAKGDDPTTARGSVLRKPVCWWSNLDGTTTIKPVRVDFEVQRNKTTVKATKYVRRADIAEALSQGVPYRADVTFTPDASPETNSVDGYVLRSVTSDTWAHLRDGTGTYVQDFVQGASCIRLRADTSTNKWDIMGRGFYFFDTSSIGAGQQVDSGTFRVTHNGTRLFTSFELTAGICGSNSTSTTALATSDFETAQFTSFSDDGLLQSAAATITQYGFDLNAAGMGAVDMEGLTRICLLDKTYDMANTPPTWGQSHEATFGWYFAERTSPAGQAPELEIIHSEASGGGGGMTAGKRGRMLAPVT